MTLHEAIEKVLRENNNFMSANEIAVIIDSNRYYVRKDQGDLTSDQVLLRAKNHPSLFLNINGHILLQEENKFKNLISSYYYLANLLRGNFLFHDIQFINAVLFFYKRLLDINDRPGRKYPIDYFDSSKNIVNLIDSGSTWIKNLENLERYYIGPKGIFEECSNMLLKLDNSKKLEVSHIISQLNTSLINDDEFGNIYDFLINSSQIDGFKTNTFSTPESLKTLMVELLDAKENKTIFDPVAGSGGLFIKALKYNKTNGEGCKGIEIINRVAQLGNMNLIMNGLNRFEIESKNCFEEINDEKQYDYIIANLPLNGFTNSYEHYMLYNQYNLNAPKSGRSFASFVLFILNKLNEHGKAVFTVSESFLTSQGREKDIRKVLIENDYLESVISLPTGSLLPYTNAKASILIINKDKSQSLKNKIKFIKAKAINFDKKSILIDNEVVLKSYFSDLDYSKNSQLIQTSNLRNFILSTEAYDDEYFISNLMLKEGTGKLLSDFVQIKAGIQPDKNDLNENGELTLIKIENLSRDILDINLTINKSHSVNNSNRYIKHIIKEDCVLVARIGDNLKPTIYRHTDNSKSILLHNGVYALIPSKKKTKLNLEYLYYQLHSAFILEQIKSKKVGTVMPYITITNLNQLVIPYVDLEFQANFVNTQKANLIATEKARIEERIKELGYIEEVEEKELNIVRTITHQLKHHLTGISLILDKINAISINNNLGILKEYEENDQRLETASEFEQSENDCLDVTIKKAIKKANSVNNILKDVEKAIIFTLEYSNTKILHLLSDLKNEYKDKNFSIEINSDDISVEISKTHFEDLINTLIENAEEHSFKDIKKPKISFNIKSDSNRGLITIDYKNNGIPLTITEKEFKSILTKSIKSNGTGIGGYYINKIVEAHKGSLKVVENLTTGVHFIIELPIKQNENE
ncbi:N-6 DNA methylase [Flavobacterium aquidurense]|uniref:N-6 DNA methylase n=1 Tax=Flavobacterium aquidurense TaxID=362413 RepID=UPI003757C4C2